MKFYKRITIWILISLTIQIIGLHYLDKYYFSESSDIKISKRVETPTKEVKNIVIKVESSAKQISTSWDGKYLSYYLGDKLQVVDTDKGTVNIVALAEGATLSFSKWLPDRNRIILAEKMTKNGKNIVKFYYYDVSKNVSEEVRNDAKEQEIYLDLKTEQSEVEDIELSPMTNVMYVKISNLGNRSVIYRLNIMSDMNKLYLNSYAIGKMQIIYTEDELYFEDLLYKKIMNSEGYSINIQDVKEPSILGSDNENNVYIGSVKDGLVTKIDWGLVKGKNATWNSKDLATPTEVRNIYISLDGKIYIDDNLNAIVTELTTGNTTSYTGVLESIYSKGIVSIDDGKLVKTLFK